MPSTSAGSSSTPDSSGRSDDDELAACRELIARRAKREPVAYILGRWGFRGLERRRRPARARPAARDGARRRPLPGCCSTASASPPILDVGTGSGAIALSLASEVPAAAVCGCDVSDGRARGRARRTARGSGSTSSGSCPISSTGWAAAGSTCVVSNPPYVAAAEIEGLEPEVRDWEPRGATVAGETGLEVIERLVAAAAPGRSSPAARSCSRSAPARPARSRR